VLTRLQDKRQQGLPLLALPTHVETTDIRADGGQGGVGEPVVTAPARRYAEASRVTLSLGAAVRSGAGSCWRRHLASSGKFRAWKLSASSKTKG
jgi:hypothetical protein